MKKLMHILVLFTLFQSSAQNLVPNPSFELKTDCPWGGGLSLVLEGWFEAGTVWSVDYFNRCDVSGDYSVPSNTTFYQDDNRGCDGYVASVLWNTFSQNAREHIGIELNEPMVVGERYYLSFATVRSGTHNKWDLPIRNVSMRLSEVEFIAPNGPVDNFAHLTSSTIIQDTMNWVRITGSIIADSAYRYVYLGNFFTDSNTETMTLNCSGCSNSQAYYLFDDVCISTDSTYCYELIDNIACNVGLDEINKPTKQLIRVTDLMGRDTEDKPNTLLIYVYSDGTTEKVYRFE